MKIKTNTLTDVALDWAVVKCANPAHWMVSTHQDNKDQWHVTLHGERGNYAPSTDWAQGGPIIERERITVSSRHDGWWRAWLYNLNDEPHTYVIGPTPLIAAMRCFVASKLGDEVEIPNELLT